jgi:hypothetical protein
MKFFDGLKAYYMNLNKAALLHPDPMMRLESQAELAFLRFGVMMLLLYVVYIVIGLLFGVYLCWIERKCL